MEKRKKETKRKEKERRKKKEKNELFASANVVQSFLRRGTKRSAKLKINKTCTQTKFTTFMHHIFSIF